MKNHPLFAWLGQDAEQIPLGRLSTYGAALGFAVQVLTHPTPRREEEPLEVFLQSRLALYERSYIERELGSGFVAAVAFKAPSDRAGFVFVKPRTPAAVALWAIGLADLDNPLPLRQRLSELCQPLLQPLAPLPTERAQSLAQSELSRLHEPTTQAAFNLLIDGLQLQAHGLPGLMFAAGDPS